MARLSEASERYDDMVHHMAMVAKMGLELSTEERALFSAAFKNAVGARRQAWRALTMLEQKERLRGETVEKSIKAYRAVIEEEIRILCHKILDLLTKEVLPLATGAESKVFLHKLHGDYCRYLTEFEPGAPQGKHAQLAEDAHDSYKLASDIALNDLPPTNPVRLGLALNFSVFYYEVLNSPERACLLAKAAFDDAISAMDNLEDDEYQDSASIMQLLRDNLTLWTADMQEASDHHVN
ncbi:hypothetical protein FOZ63_032238 [Perkinsus olseni]|nr:hypothetical protein FOZ63_032238 [Perkinsus olseni]